MAEAQVVVRVNLWGVRSSVVRAKNFPSAFVLVRVAVVWWIRQKDDVFRSKFEVAIQ